jgi:hypothetical protein
MVAKRFFYVCAGLLCLAVAYHLGARGAGAQVVSGNPVVAVTSGCPNYSTVVVTANGDLWGASYCSETWTHVGNVFGGGPIPVKPETFGRLKARYRSGGN